MDYFNKSLCISSGLFLIGLAIFGRLGYLHQGISNLNLVGKFFSYKMKEKLLKQLNVGLAVDKSFFIQVNYLQNGTLYTINIPKDRSRQIAAILKPSLVNDTEMYINITEDLSKELGPYRNFHSIPTTPLMLGHPELYIEYKNGDWAPFKGSERISITNQ